MFHIRVRFLAMKEHAEPYDPSSHVSVIAMALVSCHHGARHVVSRACDGSDGPGNRHEHLPSLPSQETLLHSREVKMTWLMASATPAAPRQGTSISALEDMGVRGRHC